MLWNTLIGQSYWYWYVKFIIEKFKESPVDGIEVEGVLVEGLKLGMFDGYTVGVRVGSPCFGVGKNVGFVLGLFVGRTLGNLVGDLEDFIVRIREGRKLGEVLSFNFILM